MKKVVIIGGNAAGMSAASQIKRQQPEWEVIVFEKRDYISYAACGIPYYIQGLVEDLDQLISFTPEEAVQKRKVNLKTRHKVLSIDPQLKTVSVDTPTGTSVESFDFLLISTGARPVRTGIDYTPSERIYNAVTLGDAESIRRFIDKENPKKCAVIGGGYIAIEMIEALRERGLETHLIHRREDLSRNLEKELSTAAKKEMEKQGVILNLSQHVTAVKEKGGLVEVETEHDKFTYDLVIVATGVEPESTLAKNCGIETGIKGAIRVNKLMQTNYPYIYAAGDCTETKNIITGEPYYVALALKANKEGVIAGVNISGVESETFPGVLGTAITKLFDIGLARTGLTLAEADKHGYDAFKFKLSNNSKSNYYPGGGLLTAVLVAEKKEGRVLGAQMFGPVDSVKRIDVYATAITAKMTLDQIFQLDLSYAPPFSPVYDLVVLSGRVGRKMI
ncbi:MAG: FAD-dependent oxidoreductase [Bacillota bacterium]|nr:FAD-dependent oxidoreductase [Bacillota bacterium]